jgi:RHS repeat-associated protein
MSRTYFFWDPLSDNILQERDESGTVTAEYTTEPGLYGNLISQNRGGVESQYHFDPQGSTLALTDDNQQVTDTYSYTAFGEVTEQTGSTANPFQYVGEKGYYRDAETGEYGVRRRQLQPGYSRWLSSDPMLAPPSHYVYSSNRTTFLTDPSGLAPNYECTVFTFFMRPDGFLCGGYSVFIEGGTLTWNLYKKCVGTICNLLTLQNSDAVTIGLGEANEQFPPPRTPIQARQHVALRHCIASGVLAIESSCACARCVGVHRELYQTECESQPKREGERGEFNNGHGRLCAGCTSATNRTGGIGTATKTIAQVIECCKAKLTNGELDTVTPELPGHEIILG